MAQSPANYAPELFYFGPNTRAWATTGNTDVVADANVNAHTIVVIQPTSAFAGRWYVTVTAGTGFTVTSSSSETGTTTTYSYKLL